MSGWALKLPIKTGIFLWNRLAKTCQGFSDTLDLSAEGSAGWLLHITFHFFLFYSKVFVSQQVTVGGLTALSPLRSKEGIIIFFLGSSFSVHTCEVLWDPWLQALLQRHLVNFILQLRQNHFVVWKFKRFNSGSVLYVFIKCKSSHFLLATQSVSFLFCIRSSYIPS